MDHGTGTMPDSTYKRRNMTYFCPKGHDSAARPHKGQDSEQMPPDS